MRCCHESRGWAVVGAIILSGASLLAQTYDTGTDHKAAAEVLRNSNSFGAARLACPAAIFPVPMSNPGGGGPPRAAGTPGAASSTTIPARDTWYAEGGQVFDNLYLLTTRANSAWAVNTSAGIILIDTLFGYAGQDEIVGGLKKAGLDPTNIKYIVVSHAHADHDGSVKFLQDTYKPHVIMDSKEWELTAREVNPPRRDIVASDGQKLTLGDTTVTIYITPGHTVGTLSVLVPVKDHGVPHLAMEWGGTALNGNTSKEMLQSYISNAGRFLDIAYGSGADVIIANHTEYNDALARFERTKERKPGEPHPWVVGKAEVRNYLVVLQECAKSWLAISEGRP